MSGSAGSAGPAGPAELDHVAVLLLVAQPPTTNHVDSTGNPSQHSTAQDGVKTPQLFCSGSTCPTLVRDLNWDIEFGCWTVTLVSWFFSTQNIFVCQAI